MSALSGYYSGRIREGSATSADTLELNMHNEYAGSWVSLV